MVLKGICYVSSGSVLEVYRRQVLVGEVQKGNKLIAKLDQ